MLAQQGCKRIVVVDEYDHIGGNHIDWSSGGYTFDIGSLIFQDDSPLLKHFPELLAYYVPIQPRWARLTPQRLIAWLLASPRTLRAVSPPGLDWRALVRPADAGWTVDDVPLLDEAAELLGEDDSAERAAARRRREDWQEHGEDVWDEGGEGWVFWGPGEVVEWDEGFNWGGFFAGAALGTILTAAAFDDMHENTACAMSQVVVAGVTYIRCGDNWYNRVMQGGTVNYVVVAAPPGF